MERLAKASAHQVGGPWAHAGAQGAQGGAAVDGEGLRLPASAPGGLAGESLQNPGPDADTADPCPSAAARLNSRIAR